MEKVKLSFRFVLSPLMEEVTRLRIGLIDIYKKSNIYKKNEHLWEGEIDDFVILKDKLNVWYTAIGPVGQECTLEIKINGKPLPYGLISAIAPENHFAMCDNNGGKGYALPI